MATAAKQSEPQRAGFPTTLPKGVGDDKRIVLNSRFIHPMQIAETLDDGETVIITELPDAPLGTKEIYTQHRMCGDFYCFIETDRGSVAGTGDTLKDAFASACQSA